MKDGRIPFSMSLTRRGALKGAAAIGVGLAAPAAFLPERSDFFLLSETP